MTATAETSFDPAALQRLLDGRYAEVRERARQVLSRPEFAPVIGLPTDEYRERVLEWAKTLAVEGASSLGFPVEYGGSNDPGAVLMLLAAKGLLTDYGDHFDDLNPVGTVTFVASQVVERVVERLFARKIAQVITDAVPSRDEHRNVLDRDYQLELFRWREGHVTASVANRFKRGLGEGYDPFEVFRAVEDHAADAAGAHIDRLILEAFVSAIESCGDEQLRGPLNRLCDLYALANVEADRGFFQEHGRLGSARCKQITREVNRLCDEVPAQAGRLVDSFGIPDAILAAPIGLRDEK